MAITYKYGIDFGTTNSSIALHCDLEGRGVLSNEVFNVDGHTLNDRKVLPSLVYIDASGETKVGTVARRKHASDDMPASLKTLVSKVKLALDQKKDDVEIIRFGRRIYRISDVIAIILKEIKQKAELQHVEKTSGIVFGVPVNYNDECKRIMLEATVKAGFYKTLREAECAVEFLSEPVAVALAYGMDLNVNKNVLVFDFGGGTLDLAIVQLNKSNGSRDGVHKVVAKHRITLGGELYTEVFFKNLFIKKYGKVKFLEMFGYDRTLSVDEIWQHLHSDPDGVQFIEYLDQAKCILSLENDTIFHFPFSTEGRAGNITCTLSREEFEEAIRDTFYDIRNCIHECLNEAHMYAGEIDEVLMAGGTSLIPAILNLVREIFGTQKVRNPNNNALTSIVKGLAARGYRVDDREWLDDVVDSDYSIWDDEKGKCQIVVPRNTKVNDTQFDKENVSGGRQIEIMSIDAGLPRIQVFQNSEKIGEFTLPMRGGGHYKVFFEIDRKRNWLVVHVYDMKTMLWYDDMLEHNIINIK